MPALHRRGRSGSSPRLPRLPGGRTRSHRSHCRSEQGGCHRVPCCSLDAASIFARAAVWLNRRPGRIVHSGSKYSAKAPLRSRVPPDTDSRRPDSAVPSATSLAGTFGTLVKTARPSLLQPTTPSVGCSPAAARRAPLVRSTTPFGSCPRSCRPFSDSAEPTSPSGVTAVGDPSRRCPLLNTVRSPVPVGYTTSSCGVSGTASWAAALERNQAAVTGQRRSREADIHDRLRSRGAPGS